MSDHAAIDIRAVDHIGIRVANAERAMTFYRALGFELLLESDLDAVIIMKNDHGVEINLIINANNAYDGRNVLMDVEDKFAGFTHVALRVGSIVDTITALKANDIPISQGPVTFGDDHVSVFVRDPDLNVLELRGREQDGTAIEGLTIYTPG